MELSAEHEQALRELRSIEAQGEALRLEGEGTVEDRTLRVPISVSTSGWRSYPGGIEFGAREALELLIPARFPIEEPHVWASDFRWANRPHVNWGRSLCLYADPASQWEPADGMFGFIEQLALWLEHAAEGRLDPDAVPAHPLSVLFETVSRSRLVARVDTPLDKDSGETHKIVWAHLNPLPGGHYEIVDWRREEPAAGELVACAFLTPQPIKREYPTRLSYLLSALDDLGIPMSFAVSSLIEASRKAPGGMALFLVVGTANRGTSETPWSHLVGFRVPPDRADDLRALGTGADVGDRVYEWSKSEPLEYCPIIEARPAVTVRRDEDTQADAFRDRHVVVLGCGALGGWMAELLARSGVAKLRLVDKGVVSPGLLVRQPYVDSDVAQSKAERLAARLRSIAPEVAVDAWDRNAIDVILDGSVFDGADLIIDATVSRAVAAALEFTLLRRAPITVASVATDAEAQRGLLIYTGPRNPVTPYALDRRAHAAMARLPRYRHFRDAFWASEASPRLVHPEPGCSAPTFRGSAGDAVSVAGTLFNLLGECILREREAAARFFAIAGTEHTSREHTEAGFDWESDEVVSTAAGTEVRISADAAAHIRKSVAEVAPDESGGMLFGKRDNATNVVYVDLVVRAPNDSTGSPTGFIRGIEGVDHLVHRLRFQSGAEYLGDWHSHPQGGTGLSGIDKETGAGLSHEGASLLIVAGGDVTNADLVGHVLARPPGSPAVPAAKPPSRPESQTPTVVAPVVRGRGQRARRRHRPARLQPCDNPAPPRQPLDPLPPGQRPIAVALSGGGFRATLTALGALRFLSDAGHLSSVRIVSSVSGGSIANALLARQWAVLRDAQFAPTSFDTSVVQPFVERVSQKSFTAALAKDSWRALIPRRTRTHVLARGLDAWFFDGTRLEDLPTGAWFELNAANLDTGVRYRFDRDCAGDYVIGSVPTAGTRLLVATAVAASAAVPLYFPPLKLNDLHYPCASSDLGASLVDGGCYDNLALEAVRARPEMSDPFVVAVNAGAVLEQGRASGVPVIGNVWRAQALLYRQTTALRSRALVRDFERPGQLDGVTFSLGTVFRSEHLPEGGASRLTEWHAHAPEQDETTRLLLERLPTTFARIPPDVAEALLYRGWWLCGSTLSVYHHDLLPAVLPSWKSMLGDAS